jgi:hypothetical protein
VPILAVVLVVILLPASVPLYAEFSQNSKQQPPVYVGISFGGDTFEQAKLLIDRTKTYTNLFVLNTGPISSNRTAVQEICDYAVDNGLHVIVNLGTWTNRTDWSWRVDFFDSCKQKYGDDFLGVYYDDEPAGIPMDWNWPDYFTRASPLFSGASPLNIVPIHYKLEMSNITGIPPQNYTTEAKFFHDLVLHNRGHMSLTQNNLTSFTSDYLLYWFDYSAGYDVMLAQVGWNQSENMQISQIRGAATVQNKDWGVILTWKYMQPPYLDTGQNLYDQMKEAYNAGAKYIMLFNYPYNLTDNPYGTMTNEHFLALQTFWDKVVTQQPPTTPHAQAALVLPNDYGWGMRNPNDTIWGFWPADAKAPLIWENTQKLLGQYGLGFDIVYDDPAFPLQGNYSKIYYWNQTL